MVTIDEAFNAARAREATWASPVPSRWHRNVSDRSDMSIDVTDEAFDFTIVENTPRNEMQVPLWRRLGDMRNVIAGGAQRLSTKSKGARSNDLPIGLDLLFGSPGSLPKALPKQERSQALRELTPTATFEMLSKVPKELLTAKGTDGQNLRRKMLDGATIVFFTAGYEGKRFVYERAHELGVKSVMIESPDSWSRNLVDEGIISKFIPIDMSQPSDAVYYEALRAIRELGDDPVVGAADGIATVVELSVPVAVRLAETLGLPGHLPECVDIARDKARTREALKAAGLPTPANCRVKCKADLELAAATVGFPAVLKPISGAASLGVKKVSSKDVLEQIYVEVSNELASLVVSSGALVKDAGDGIGVNAGAVIDTTFLLERYLDGDEVDVDIVMSNGEWWYAAVSDNGPTLEPYFNETWAVTPSLLSRQKQVELKELAIASVKAIGFTEGVFHVECKYTSQGPHLIEVNARMGGGPVHKTNLLTWNVDLVEETLFAAVGIPSRPDVPKEPVQCIANSDVNSLRSGILADVSFLDPLRKRAGVVSFSPHVRPGEAVVGPEDGLPTWLVEIVVSRPTPQEAFDFLLQLESEIQAKVRLVPGVLPETAAGA